MGHRDDLRNIEDVLDEQEDTGKPPPVDPLVAHVLALFKTMTEEQRGAVLCWFCRYCHRYMGPGDHMCHCENDE